MEAKKWDISNVIQEAAVKRVNNEYISMNSFLLLRSKLSCH